MQRAFPVGDVGSLRDTGCMGVAPNPVRMSVEEYLATSYRPDCDYVDGEIEELNLGEKEHAILQRGPLFFLLMLNRVAWGRILRTLPLLCVEILSPRDSLSSIRQRADDYLNFGTEHVWVVEPGAPQGLRLRPDGDAGAGQLCFHDSRDAHSRRPERTVRGAGSRLASPRMPLARHPETLAPS